MILPLRLRDILPSSFESCWSSPANIAFVKYWGKKGHQIPANPSLSMTLNKCVTTTKSRFSLSEKLNVQLSLQGNLEEKFAMKIHSYLDSLSTELPWVKKLSVEIETSNTFPHGAGIASSASGLSAFVLTFTEFLLHHAPEVDRSQFFQIAGYLARLASGSACRSVYGGFSTWGETSLFESSDFYATPFEVHKDLASLYDTVLVIDGNEKNVSSRDGHGRMSDHFFAEARFNQAKHHFESCICALRLGDVELMGKILEAEALSLHSMMLTSPSVYTLLRPNTLLAIEAIWAFRKETKLPLYFTLDAGPNLHLIYPESGKNNIQKFILEILTPLSQNVIYDTTGLGPIKC